MKRLLVAASTLALAAGAFAIYTITASADAPTMNRVSTTCPGPTVNRQVDSIVSFGVAVSAHQHTESGDQNFTSTLSAKDFPSVPGHEADPGYQPTGTNCATYGDWAAYWFPTALLNGVPIAQAGLVDTYQSLPGSKVSTIPFGATMVVGNSKAQMEEPGSHVAFTCGNIDVTYPKPHDCTGTGGVVTGQIVFPDCWDGTKTFDAPAGIAMSHFTYSNAGVCPDGFVPCPQPPNPDGNDEYRGLGPVIAQLVTQQTWLKSDGTPLVNPYNADGTLALTFSSGPYYTYHGDFLNTWNHDLGNMVNVCLNHVLGGTSGTSLPGPEGCQAGKLINGIAIA
jgi:hypothetical protein